MAFDPLDGSSNIDCNVSTGTIFAVYQKMSSAVGGNVDDILRAGIDIKAREKKHTVSNLHTIIDILIEKRRQNHPSVGLIYTMLTYKRRKLHSSIVLNEFWCRRGILIFQVAGYCMYGSATELVITFCGKGVHRFTLDPSLGEFVHISADVKIPSKPKAREHSARLQQ